MLVLIGFWFNVWLFDCVICVKDVLFKFVLFVWVLWFVFFVMIFKFIVNDDVSNVFFIILKFFYK